MREEPSRRLAEPFRFRVIYLRRPFDMKTPQTHIPDMGDMKRTYFVHDSSAVHEERLLCHTRWRILAAHAHP